MNEADKNTLKHLRARVDAGEDFSPTLLVRYNALEAQALASQQGKIYLILIIVPHSKFCIIYLFFCNYQYLVLFNSHRTLYHVFIF